LITFEFKGEKLVFGDAAEESKEGMLVYRLFKEDRTCLGNSFCNLNKYKGQAWYLEDIYIFPEFERKGYGTQLLERTCQTLWQIKKMDIVLERPGDYIAPDGFDRRKWYERHGFESSPAPLTYMIRKPPEINS
jgi:GNAT superfamily N-acetyltransferase